MSIRSHPDGKVFHVTHVTPPHTTEEVEDILNELAEHVHNALMDGKVEDFFWHGLDAIVGYKFPEEERKD